MLRMGPYKPSIKKGHLSNSVKSTGSSITKENCIVSQHPSVSLGLGIHPLGKSFQGPQSRECPASRAFFDFLSANNLDGKHMFILGNLGKKYHKNDDGHLVWCDDSCQYLNCHLTSRWVCPSHIVQRPPGEQVKGRDSHPGV